MKISSKICKYFPMLWLFSSKIFVYNFSHVKMDVELPDDKGIRSDFYSYLLFRKGSKRICKITYSSPLYGYKKWAKETKIYRAVIKPWLCGSSMALYDYLKSIYNNVPFEVTLDAFKQLSEYSW